VQEKESVYFKLLRWSPGTIRGYTLLILVCYQFATPWHSLLPLPQDMGLATGITLTWPTLKLYCTACSVLLCCLEFSLATKINTLKPLFNESLGTGFSYTKSRFSLNGGYAKLHQKLFFLLIYLLYYMISFPGSFKINCFYTNPMINKLFHNHTYILY
jgi:hypothetical protein